MYLLFGRDWQNERKKEGKESMMQCGKMLVSVSDDTPLYFVGLCQFLIRFNHYFCQKM